MKAPDKLYLGRRSYGPLIGGWQTNPFESKEIESIEYIRKDEIEEYLSGWMEHATRGMKSGATAYHQGKVALIVDIRDWMNSL